jgi:hypothetical protein
MGRRHYMIRGGNSNGELGVYYNGHRDGAYYTVERRSMGGIAPNRLIGVSIREADAHAIYERHIALAKQGAAPKRQKKTNRDRSRDRRVS